MNQMSPVSVSVNGRSYAWPRVPAIAICLDGCEPAYLDEAIKAGLMPALESASSGDIAGALREGDRAQTAGRSQNRTRAALVTILLFAVSTLVVVSFTLPLTGPGFTQQGLVKDYRERILRNPSDEILQSVPEGTPARREAQRRGLPGRLDLSPMYVGTLSFDLLLGDVRSLKEKRSVIRPIVAELHRKYAVSVAEVGEQDLYRRARIGLAAVSGDHGHLAETLDRCERWMAARPEVDLLSARRRIHGEDD